VNDPATAPAPYLEIRGHPFLEGPEGAGPLQLAAGQLAFLEGESGSGKTRLLRQLVDLEPGLPGEARVAGRPLPSLEPGELRRRIGLLPQELPAHDGTGRELLAAIRGFSRNRGCCLGPGETGAWIALLELEPHLDKPIALLSGGERRRLSLVALLLPRPDLLLLDEPEAGMDSRRRALLDRFVERVLGAGAAVLWISHLPPAEAFRAARRYRLATRVPT